jgi:two-component system phosphate regulon sensor histidine kinase PhoR
LARRIGRNIKARVTVIAPDGVVLGDSEKGWKGLLGMDNHLQRPEVQEALARGSGSSMRFSRSVHRHMLYVAFSPAGPGNPVDGIVRVSLPLTEVHEALESARNPILVASVLGMGLTVLLSLFIGRRMTSGLTALAGAAREFQAGRFHHPIAVHSRDELGVLADVWSRMASSLEARISEIESDRIKLAAILDHLAEGVLAFDCEGRLMAMNPGAEALTGISLADALGKSPIEIVRNQALQEMMTAVIEAGGARMGEIVVDAFKPTVWWARCVGTGRCEGRVCGILVLSDITERKKAEGMRRDFVANVSHELRTPLTSLKGFIETLLAGAVRDPVQAERFLKMMEEDTARLARLIGDLLDLSRIEAGDIKLRMETLNLGDEIARAVSLFEERARAKKIVIENRVPENPPVQVTADRDRLRQVLVNLLDNAVKFNRENGRISVDARPEPGAVRVRVEDTGIGIPREAVERVFERFFRVDKGRSRAEGGTGLGLAIVKHLVEAHGGEISCESNPGKGSVLSFTLPFLPV